MSPVACAKPHADRVAFAFAGLAQERATIAGVCGDGMRNRLVRSIGGVAFDEENLRSGAHLRNATENVLNVSSFVACGHHHGDGEARRRFTRAGPRARDCEICQRQMAKRPGLNEQFVENVFHEGRSHGPENFLEVADHLKSRQIEKIEEVVDGQPVLRQDGLGQPERLSDGKGGLPDAAVEIDEDSSAGMAEEKDVLEGRLDVPQVVEKIRGNHEIELFAEVGTEIADIHLEKSMAGMALSGARDHFRGEVDSHSRRGLERREEVSRSASQLENPPPGRNHAPVDLLEPAVVPAAEPRALLAFTRHLVPVRPTPVPVRDSGVVPLGRVGLDFARVHSSFAGNDSASRSASLRRAARKSMRPGRAPRPNASRRPGAGGDGESSKTRPPAPFRTGN